MLGFLICKRFAIVHHAGTADIDHPYRGLMADSLASVPPNKLTTQEFRGMLAILMSIALATLDTAIANTALPAIAADLNASPAASVWVINAYQLAAVATLLPLAALGGIIGHRRVFLGG